MTEVETFFKQPREPKRKHWATSVPYASEKRIGNRELRARLCERVLARDGHRCVAGRAVPTVACSGPLDVHEVIPRSAWAKGYLVLSNCRTVCRAHHDWIGLHPLEAHRLGLHGFSWERKR